MTNKNEKKDFEVDPAKDESKTTDLQDVSDLLNKEEEISLKAYDLLEHALSLIKSEYYDDALEALRQAIGLYEQIKREEEINAINEKIAEVYILKEKSFRAEKIESRASSEILKQEKKITEEISRNQAEIEPSKLKVEQQKREFEVSKKQELSEQAYKLIERGSELAKNHQYDHALESYRRAVNLFDKLNWTVERQKLSEAIDLMKLEKEEYFKEIEKTKLEKQEKLEAKVKQEEFLEEEAKKRQEFEVQAKRERIEGLEKKKEEEERFMAKIDEMVDRVQKMDREYELSLKKGTFLKSPYVEIIQIYEKIQDLLKGKGWIEEARLYNDSIKLYRGKLEKDKKLHEIELLKIQKQKEIEELHKIKEEPKILKPPKPKEVEILEKQNEELLNKAWSLIDEVEKEVKNYELSSKTEILKQESPYQKAILAYKEAVRNFQKIGWENEANRLTATIKFYEDKKENDEKERVLEAERVKRHEQELKEQEEERLKAIQTEEREKQQALAEIAKIKERKTKQEQEVSKLAFELISTAESLAKQYESDLNAGMWPECPYDRVIEIYNKAKSKFEQINWTEQAKTLTNTIAYYKEKSEADKKERELEAERVKRREQEFKKQEETLLAEQLQEQERQRALAEIAKSKERKTKQEREVSKLAFELISSAEKMAKQYESDLDAGMQPEYPYNQVIEIYNDAKANFEQIGWKNEAKTLINTITYYTQKLEEDKKERALEAERIKRREQEFKEQEEFLKIEENKERARQRELEELTKAKALKTQKEQEVSAKIFDMIKEAEGLTKIYEDALKLGKLPECPYKKVRDIYRQAKDMFEEIQWISQANTLIKTISYYTEKIEADKKYREFLIEKEKKREEELKKQEEILLIEAAKERNRQSELAEKAKMKELRTQKEQEVSKKAFSWISEAEDLASKYENALNSGELPDCPFERVLQLYKQAKNSFEKIQWKGQISILKDTIDYYVEKIAADKKFREFRAEKIKKQGQEIKEQREAFLAEEALKRKRQRELEELEMEKQLKIQKEKEVSKLAFDIIDHAESLAKQYESDLRENKLPDCVYGDIIDMYREAKVKFEEIGFTDQATTLMSTINYYGEKLEADKENRKLRANRLLKREQELKEQREALLAEKLKEKELKQKLAELERIKKLELQKEEQISKPAFDIIAKAESLVKQYESELEEGKLPDCIYGDVIEIYRKAQAQFEQIGWSEQATALFSTINYYKEKLDSDKKVRVLRAKRIKVREQELKELDEKHKLAELEIEKEKKLREEQERKVKEERKIIETKKVKAFNILDEAKLEITKNNFIKAISLYKESEAIFIEIGWQEGIEMVRESIISIKNKKEKLELEQKEIERQRKEKLFMEKETEEKVAKEKEIEKIKQEEKRKQILEIQEQKDREKAISEQAYYLLEEGTMFLDNKEFNKAQENYLNARDLFKKIEWLHEVSRINNELLFKLKREQSNAEKLKEEEKRATLMKKEEKKRQEHEKIKMEEERKKLKKEIISESIDRNIKDHWDRANKLIESLKYNEGILQLKEVAIKMKKSGKGEENEKINQEIEGIKNQAHIPLIALEELNLGENMEKFESSYKALDKAEISLTNNNLKKAISELNEAKFNLKNTKIGNKFNEKIDEIVDNCKKKIGIKETSKTEEKTAPMAVEGEDVQATIAARREERKKKVLDLLGKK